MTAADIRALLDREIERDGEEDAGSGDNGLHGDFLFLISFTFGISDFTVWLLDELIKAWIRGDRWSPGWLDASNTRVLQW